MATIEDFQRWKKQRRHFACLTAYDAPTGRMVSEAGVPLILVGDSLGNSVLGYPDTVPVTMDEMIHHAKAVRRGAPDCFVVADMPFLSYQVSDTEAIRNAGRFRKEARSDSVKIEGPRPGTVRALVEAGIPVMGHLGLTPQSATLLGGMRVQGKTAAAARRLVDDAMALAEAGAFAVVLECIPEELAALITERVSVPTIGIGAGRECDGQILVFTDVVGIEGGYRARFVRRYAEVEEVVGLALRRYREDVEQGSFPADDEVFRMSETARAQLPRRPSGDE